MLPSCAALMSTKNIIKMEGIKKFAAHRSFDLQKFRGSAKPDKCRNQQIFHFGCD